MPPKNGEASGLPHTKRDCEYRIVLTPKCRRKAIYAKLRSDIGKCIRRRCMYKGVGIIEAHAMPDHMRMLARMPPKPSVSSFMGYLKGKASLMIFDERANLKYSYGARHFWPEGYCVSTAWLNKKTVQNCIRSQELEDQIADRRSLKERMGPFTGKQGRQGRLGDLKRGMIAPASNRPYRPDRKTAP